MFNPEILAPGGSFNSSIHAFEAGADAVYIGMSAFSARKGARNFTLEELRRLTAYGRQNKKKIFTAINTILKNDEMSDVVELVHQLSLIKVDALIVQDPGLASIVNRYLPDLEIHASTQMAVHNSHGIDFLKKAGFSRIILSRELTLSEIGKLREEHRDVELEVFIHGAMCYSFSGICLASGALLNRSGNRGECGQICRSWFESPDDDRFRFSANDMKAGSLVRDLRDMGIDSLKIEGRLKSPEYVSHTVAYYRSILDGADAKKINHEDTLSTISFSRDQTTAFFKDPKGTNLINNQYPSHTGISAGEILTSDSGSFTLKSETELSDRDGLLILTKGEKKQFAMKSDGKKTHYREGETVKILYRGKIDRETVVRKVSGHNLQLKEFNSKSWKPWKTPVTAELILKGKELSVKTVLFGEPVEITEELTVENSDSGRDLKEILLQNLSKSGLSDFVISSLKLTIKTGDGDSALFIPPSELKLIKNSFYRKLETSSREIIKRRTSRILEEIEEKLQSIGKFPYSDIVIPQRMNMTGTENSLPFTDGNHLLKGDQLFLPLSPIQFHKKDFEKLTDTIDTILEDPRKKVILGLNNISHFYFVERYSSHENVFFFTDYCSYTANAGCLLFYRERIPRLLFSYYWIEDREGKLKDTRTIEKDFSPHLFVSRICYKKHNGSGSCQNCSKDLSYELKQREKVFTVVIKDCITWLFQKG